MALAHMPADRLEMLKAAHNPTKAAACGNFQAQNGDTLADLPPRPPTCPACYVIVHPGAIAGALAARRRSRGSGNQQCTSRGGCLALAA
jgi:hypothetical protein